jgi:hypothetical protein
MKSQINLIITLTIFLFAAIVSYLLLQWRLEKKILTAEERIRVKELIPWYVWLPLVLFIPACSIIFLEVFGFGDGFSDIAAFSLYLVIFLFLFGYKFTRISKINLPAEFVGKWRKLDWLLRWWRFCFSPRV